MGRAEEASLVTDHQLDTSGLYCPEPVMMLHQVIRKMQTGQSVYMLATDPSTTRDVVKFCMHLGHEMIAQHRDHSDLARATRFEYWIRKG